jgi:mRNA-degrading endonuclease toxin of MazEF toxin-antitoxin module
MRIERWDIVSLPFPFVEGYEAKRRPGLVISTDMLHKKHSIAFVAMITTARNMQDIRPDDIQIKSLEVSGLPAPCVIRLARTHTIELASSIRKIGVLGPADRRAVTALLKSWLAV